MKILNNDKLETLDASDNLLSSIILSNHSALRSINVDGNAEITLIDLSNSPNIESISARKTNLSTLIVKDKKTIVVKESTVWKQYKDGINIVGKNGLVISDATGGEIMNYPTPVCIIGGLEGVKSKNQTKYVSLFTTSREWYSTNEFWTNLGWNIGYIGSIDMRDDYKSVLASYNIDYLSKDQYYWTPYENSSYASQGQQRGYYTRCYCYSSIKESSSYGYQSKSSFGMYQE